MFCISMIIILSMQGKLCSLETNVKNVSSKNKKFSVNALFNGRFKRKVHSIDLFGYYNNINHIGIINSLNKVKKYKKRNIWSRIDIRKKRNKRWIDVDEDLPDKKIEINSEDKSIKGSRTPLPDYETLRGLVGEFDKSIPNKIKQVNDITNLKSEGEEMLRPSSKIERHFSFPLENVFLNTKSAESALPSVHVNDKKFAATLDKNDVPLYKLSSIDNYAQSSQRYGERYIPIEKSILHDYFSHHVPGTIHGSGNEENHIPIAKPNYEGSPPTRQNVITPMISTGNFEPDERSKLIRRTQEYHFPQGQLTSHHGRSLKYAKDSMSPKIAVEPLLSLFQESRKGGLATHQVPLLDNGMYSHPRIIIFQSSQQHRNRHHHHHKYESDEDVNVGDSAVCQVSNCKNGGTCNVVSGTTKCSCLKGFRGPTCEDASLCLPNPCKHGGSCTETESGFVCTCSEVAIGELCETLSHCHPNPCRNNGYCYERGATFECSCLYGFKGSTCALSSFCLPVNPCLNNGICSEDDNGYKCLCTKGFTGANCEAKRTTCSLSTCQNGGTCTDEGGQIHCSCLNEYKGRFCEEKEFRPCTPITCLFGGSCIEVSRYEYQCLCPPGRTGKRCSAIREEPCAHCHAKAKCLDNGCICRDGFVGNGAFCERVPNKCHPNPCENGGTCVDKYFYLDETFNNANIGTIDGRLEDESKSGVRYAQKYEFDDGFPDRPAPISLSIDNSNDRLKGLELFNQKEGIVKKETLPRKPFTLIRTLNLTHELFRRSSDSQKRFKITQKILNDFIDDEKSNFARIDQKHNTLMRYYRNTENTPFGVDKYQLDYNEFACACTPNFKGERCEAVEPCHPNPCHNGGKCTEFNNIPTCECISPYTGSFCNATDSCHQENICKNNGICINENGFAVCRCKHPYHGSRCEDFQMHSSRSQKAL